MNISARLPLFGEVLKKLSIAGKRLINTVFSEHHSFQNNNYFRVLNKF